MRALIATSARRADRVDRTDHARPDAEAAGRRRAGLLRPARHLNGPTEAINGRLEHLRGSALGFRNLTNAVTHRSTGGSARASNPEVAGARARVAVLGRRVLGCYGSAPFRSASSPGSRGARRVGRYHPFWGS